MSNMFSHESRQFKFDILVNICRALDCGIDDIMEIVADNETADTSDATCE